jgi:uncharacterized membrane protein YraQ (UPF0718 family)
MSTELYRTLGTTENWLFWLGILVPALDVAALAILFEIFGKKKMMTLGQD